jgi:hypothetical protein
MAQFSLDDDTIGPATLASLQPEEEEDTPVSPLPETEDPDSKPDPASGQDAENNSNAADSWLHEEARQEDSDLLAALCEAHTRLEKRLVRKAHTGLVATGFPVFGLFLSLSSVSL